MTHDAHSQRRLGRHSGFSLIELMIAMLLGLVMLAGVTSLVVGMSRNHAAIQDKSELFDNGRYATKVLADEVRHAGFYGQYDEPRAPSSLPDPCHTSASNIEDAWGLVVQGYDNPSDASALSCLDSADHVSGTDILVVRRAAREATPVDELTEGMIYLQGRPRNYILEAAVSDNTDNKSRFDLMQRDGTTRAAIRRFRVDIYFVSPCLRTGSATSCDSKSDDGDPILTLKRYGLTASGGSATYARVPVASGIQQLQLDYGIDGNDDGQPDAESTSAAYVTNPSSVSNWANVVTVRAHALGRTLDTITGHTDERRYTLGKDGDAGPFNDAYKRHRFQRVARVVNRSSRREEP